MSFPSHFHHTPPGASLPARATGKRRLHRALRYETLESRRFLTSIQFTANQVVESEARSPGVLASGDMDGDGDDDLLMAGDQIGWYENLGSGRFGSYHAIHSHPAVSSLATLDVDQDGDLDVWWTDPDSVWWTENLGDRTFAEGQRIVSEAEDALLVDFDKDGDLDVAAINSDDFLFVARNRNGEFSSRRLLGQTRAVGRADIDGDGNMDLLSGERDGLVWYRNTDRGFVGASPVGSPGILFGDLHGIDVDSDGDQDFVLARNRNLSWYENIDGAGTFSNPRLITRDSHNEVIQSADMDGDGDFDLVLGGHENTLAWAEYNPVTQSFTFHPIDQSRGLIEAMILVDLDGDLDEDIAVVGSESYERGWYENLGGGSFAPQQRFASPGEPGHLVLATDMDGDGDIDLLADSQFADGASWYENVDAAGTFRRNARPVQSNVYFSSTDIQGDGSLEPIPQRFMTFGDINGDGHDDLVRSIGVARWLTNGVFWHERLPRFEPDTYAPARAVGGSRAFGTVAVFDVDADGDNDVISASFGGINFHPNLDGEGTFGGEIGLYAVEVSSTAVYLEMADLDNDSYLDMVHASPRGLIWHRNRDGQGGFEGEATLWPIRGSQGLAVTDMDNDGDRDIVVAGDDGKLAWYELDAGDPLAEHVILPGGDGSDRIESLVVADMDGDGDQDIAITFFQRSRLAWYESDLADALVGDANRDGVVDFADFIRLAANFNQVDAVWEDGDFDGDKMVSFEDFILLTQHFGRRK